MDAFMERNLAYILLNSNASPDPCLAVKCPFKLNGPLGCSPGPDWILLLVATTQATMSAQKMEKIFMQEGNYYFPAL